MTTIEDMFIIHRARSGLSSDYGPGPICYVGNGFNDNGIVGYVTPLPNNKVFRFRAIVVSAFCEATVQIPPFIACSRAGNGLVVLEPRTTTTIGQLAYVAAYINQTSRWRFNWYRQITADRVRRLVLPDDLPANVPFDVRSLLPLRTAST